MLLSSFNEYFSAKIANCLVLIAELRTFNLIFVNF